jgi:uncharacterized protein YjiS (DUF1127 family)
MIPMSAPIAKDRLAFQLPNLTYVDARYEEPNLRASFVEQPRGFGVWLAARMTAFRAWREKNAALAELEGMSEHELADIGLSRADLHRLFDPAHNQDLVARSGG